ncbi:DNA recombination protein RecN [Plantactinospora sp. B24E8]|uniref:DNA recombination protein RecN n=1 Tax=Plantactinospora sp. B24E8 TaxID=3153567 RepID=UPI00325C3F8E
MPDAYQPRGIRLRKLRLAGATGTGRHYDVSFMDSRDEAWRGLSVIAGPSQTGKTSVVDFVRYCLGDDEHPQHPEVLAHVRSAMLESELSGHVTTIERVAAGPPSSFASLWKAPLRALEEAVELRLPTEPPSDPSGLSQALLAACGLDNVDLPVAPKQEKSATQILSIRDLFRVMYLPNERLDSKNLVFEHSNFMIRQKFSQLIDVIFDVHDAAGTDLAAKAQRATEAAREAERVAASLRTLVQAEHPLGSLVLESDRDEARREARELTAQLAEVDQTHMSRDNTLTDMRRKLEALKNEARLAAIRVRNRESLMERLAVLRGQYADDKKKLTFLKEAERVFNPLHVSICPACLSALDIAPSVTAGSCSLCGHNVTVEDGALLLGKVADAAESSIDRELPKADDEDGIEHTLAVIQAELRATSRRLDEITDYWNRLDDDLKVLRSAQEAADAAVESAAAALNQAVNLPAPYLAGRDDLTRRRGEALLRRQNAESGLRLWARVQAADENAQRLAGQAAQLRAERRESTNRPDRAALIALLSQRFGEILSHMGYPKLSQPYLDDRLMPHVRGLPYTAASSGGLVLISLAWYLTVWEVAHERQANAPGLLIIDSPQKNLGHKAREDDPDFADARLVENFYRHVKQWLATNGVGAQLVVVDNSPPAIVKDDVVVRYTRSAETPPYGLIDNAVD